MEKFYIVFKELEIISHVIRKFDSKNKAVRYINKLKKQHPGVKYSLLEYDTETNEGKEI